MTSSPGEQRVQTSACVDSLLDSLVVFVFAWVWLSLRPEPPLHPDSSRDLAFARDLVDGAELHLHGAWASFVSLEQGTAWIDLLAVCEWCGLGIAGTERVLTTLLAFAVAAVQLGVARLLAVAGPRTEPRWIARVAAIAGALALLASLPATCEMPLLWQPMLLPLPVAFVHLSAWWVLERGELLDCVALGLLSALAFDVHVVAVVLAVGPLLLVPLAARRPVVASLASLTAGLGYLVIASPAALLGNLGIAAQKGWLIPGGVLAVALVLIAVGSRSRFAKLSLRRRLELAVACEALLVAALVLAARLPSTPGLSGRYLLPFAPGLALAIALLVSRQGGTRRRAGIVASLVALGLYSAAPNRIADAARVLPLTPAYTQHEFERVAAELARAGHTWTELVVRLSGPDHEELLGGLAAILERGELPPPEPDAGLLVVPFAPELAREVLAELPPNTSAVELEDMTVLLVETPARLDRAAVTLCSGAGDRSECSNVALGVTRRVYQAHPKAWIDGDVAGAWLRERSEGPIESVTWRYSVRPGPATTLVLPPYNAPRCGWQIVAVEGFAGPGAPSGTLELPADAVGSVTISRGYDEHDPFCRRGSLGFPPAPIELDPSWTRLRDALIDHRSGR